MKDLNRRDFLRLSAGSSVAAGLSLAGCEGGLAGIGAAAKKQPNIIFLLTDDQRADTMGCAGNPIIQTPNMDAMAKGGVRFTNAFVTTSICASSRASIFSGQWTSRHGITNFRTHFSPEAFTQTYPMQLRGAGYRIGFIGKYGVGAQKTLPIDQYDYWKGFPGQGRYENKDKDGKYKHLTQIMGEQAIEFLQGCSKDRPFCLSLSFKAPHCQDGDPRQFIYDRAYKDVYKDTVIPVPEKADPHYFEALPEFLRTSEARRRWEIRFSTPEKFQESVKSYYRLIYGVDVVIGKIRQQLKQLDFDDNTVLVLIGDNGFYLGEYGLAGLRGRTVDQVALNVDIAPTILELAGVKPPEQMQGRSLVPLLKGKKPKWRTEFFYEHPFEHKTIAKTVALRTPDYKYARYVDYDYEELYDLKLDPSESINLAKDEKYKKTLESLRKRCDDLAREAKGT